MIQRNTNRARYLIEELIRCGIDQFVIAPGFRSAPLALAALSHPSAHVSVHYDERGSAFFALGYGRAIRRPCVWITTSGTAAANGFPAVVESSVDAVPMICLTADRPAELRDTGANQTIDQVHLFGHYPRWFADLPAPESEDDEVFIRSTVDYAVFKAQSGPVHLNCMFRAPLLEMDDQAKSIPEIPWSENAPPQTHYHRGGGIGMNIHDHLLKRIQAAKRGMVVVGRLQTLEEGRSIFNLCHHLGWPLFPDICAPVHAPYFTINFYDLIMRNDSIVHTHSPDVILHFGGPLVSKELQKFLANSSCDTYVLISPSSNRIDPSHVVTDRIQMNIDDCCYGIERNVIKGRMDSPWLQFWTTMDSRISKYLSIALGHKLSEPSIIWEMSRLLNSSNWLLSASSMPIRDLQSFFPIGFNGFPRIFSNRGASGIDGTIATAAGIAQACPERGAVLLGDLALLHDLNSLALLNGRNVTIVVINNNGGGIFRMLPIALGNEQFEQALVTPHHMNFRWAAKQFKIPYSQAKSLQQLEEAWVSAANLSGPHIIEVKVNLKKNVQLRKAIFSEISERVSYLLEPSGEA